MAIGVTCAAVLAATATLTGGPVGSPPASAAPALTPFGSCAEVDAWLAQARAQEQRLGIVMVGSENAATALAGSAMPGSGGTRDAAVPQAASSATDAVGPGRTGTNTQERDIDEPDAAKSVDGRLYTASGGRLHIVSVSSTRPAPLGSVAVPALRNAGPSTEILITGDRVVVLSTRVTFPPTPSSSGPQPLTRTEPPEAPAGPSAYPQPVVTSTASVVDVSDPRAPKVVSAVNWAGGTVAARLSDGVIRWVTSSPDRPTHLECTKIQRPQVSSGAGIISVDTLDPVAAAAKGATGVVDSIGVAGDGSMVYASRDRLYVATTPGGWAVPMPVVSRVGAGEVEAPPDETIIHGFDVSGREGTRYVASGRVEGRLLSQWSMSEREGHLRVATTRWLRPPTSPTTSSTEPSSSPAGTKPTILPSPTPAPVPVPNQVPRTDAAVTVLTERDGRLSVVGRVTGLGKGEQIKSVRWFDDLGVVVTFRQTDPLYVLDLTDPTRPQVKGELKVDGFSSYLHPIGNRRLLGIGNSANARTGQVTGAQIAVFDIFDPARPTRLSVATQPDAWPRAGGDSRAFSYLPTVATALYGMDGPAPQISGGTTSKPNFGSYLAGFAVRSTGRLVVVGGVPMPMEGNVRQVAVDGTRVAIVTSDGGSDSSGRVALVDASGPRLTQTGALSLGAT